MAIDMTEGEFTKKTKGSAKTSVGTKTGKAPAKRASKKATEAIIPATPVVRKTKPAKAEAAPTPAVVTPEGLTTIVAKVNVGYGNTLYIRGTGPGMSWERGVEMMNTAADEWLWSSIIASAPFVVKVLINDDTWSLDPDISVVPGEKIVIEPAF